MPRWVVIFIGASAALVVGILAAVAFYNQQVHRAQTAAAEARFKTIDAAYSVDKATQTRFISDHKQMNADLAAATKASQKRHDGGDSLSIQEVISLAHTERTKVEAIEALQRDVEATDQRSLEALTDVDGADALTRLRQDVADRNEARDDSLDMWWRAAQSIEDNFKAELDGGSDPNSDDEIARDYDETAKDQSHAQRLELDVDRESNALDHRLALEWQSAKRTLVALGGSLR